MLHLHEEEEADASSGGLQQEAETLGEDKTAVWMFTCPRGCRNDEHEDENKTYLGHIGKPESRNPVQEALYHRLKAEEEDDEGPLLSARQDKRSAAPSAAPAREFDP